MFAIVFFSVLFRFFNFYFYVIPFSISERYRATNLKDPLYLNRNVAGGGAVNPLGQTAFRVLDNVTTAYLRKIFVDLVCIVAWYFRATCHHYNAEADERIGRV